MKFNNMNILKGKFSYILSALAVLGAGAGYVMGFIDGETAIAVLWAGLAVFGIRRAM